MLFKLWAYFRGYLRLRVWGEVEKFINMSTQRGIRLWDISKEASGALLKVELSSLKALRHIARRSGSHFSIFGRYGLPFLLAKLKKRKGAVAGGLFFLAALYLLSSFVWSIEIRLEGEPGKVTPGEIIQAAGRHGLAPGVFKAKVKREEVAHAIVAEFPKLAWVGVEFRGTRAVFFVVEKVLPPEAEGAPVDLVAIKDGVIREILVLAGRPLVKEGDVVRKDQILILADQASVEGKVPQAKAQGIVRASVWYETMGEASLKEEQRALTGRHNTVYILKKDQREFFLLGPKKPPYGDYREETVSRVLPSLPGRSPWVLELKTFREIRLEVLQKTKEEAESLAYQRARSALEVMELKISGFTEVSREVNWSQGRVRLRLVLEGVEEISRTRLAANKRNQRTG